MGGGEAGAGVLLGVMIGSIAIGFYFWWVAGLIVFTVWVVLIAYAVLSIEIENRKGPKNDEYYY